MIEILIMTFVLMLTFAFGMKLGAHIVHAEQKRARNLFPSKPIPNPDPQFDEEWWKRNPPPFPMGGSAGERK